MFLQLVINSLAIGSLYALTAMGATLIYGILGILDIANAGAYLIGAYIGYYIYVSTGQLALAHTYGSGGSDSSLNAVKAVSNLLGGVKIDHYMTLTMDAVGKINDLVGGVTLTIPEDYTSIDPSFKKGATVTLKGEQAEKYVRYRDITETGSNEGRMERQTQFIQALFGQMKKEGK